MMRRTGLLLTLAALASLSGCEADRMSERGFSLPQGNAMAGREAFVYMHCHECHTVVDEQFPAVAMADPPFVELGGKVTRVKTYGELVTAIINPTSSRRAIPQSRSRAMARNPVCRSTTAT